MALLDLAAGLESTMEIFDTPAGLVALDTAPRLLLARHGQRGQQDPLQRFHPFRLPRLLGRAHQTVAAQLPTGAHEQIHAGIAIPHVDPALTRLRRADLFDRPPPHRRFARAVSSLLARLLTSIGLARGGLSHPWLLIG